MKAMYTCVAGSSACNHIAALMFAVDAWHQQSTCYPRKQWLVKFNLTGEFQQNLRRQDLQQTCQYEITFTQVYGDYGHHKPVADLEI